MLVAPLSPVTVAWDVGILIAEEGTAATSAGEEWEAARFGVLF